MTYRFCALLVLLLPINLYAEALCPDPSTISRVAGEYGWVSTDGRWQGYFASPRVGRGDSSEVTFFQGARWIQLTNMPDSAGVIECDYLGNFGNEIIRFVSTTSMASSKPGGTYWSCNITPEIPGAQCDCAGDPRQCGLPL